MNRKRDEPEPYPHSINAYWPNKGFTFYSDDGVWDYGVREMTNFRQNFKSTLIHTLEHVETHLSTFSQFSRVFTYSLPENRKFYWKTMTQARTEFYLDSRLSNQDYYSFWTTMDRNRHHGSFTLCMHAG